MFGLFMELSCLCWEDMWLEMWGGGRGGYGVLFLMGDFGGCGGGIMFRWFCDCECLRRWCGECFMIFDGGWVNVFFVNFLVKIFILLLLLRGSELDEKLLKCKLFVLIFFSVLVGGVCEVWIWENLEVNVCWFVCCRLGRWFFWVCVMCWKL